MLHHRISDGTIDIISHGLKKPVRSEEERNKLWLDYQPFLKTVCKRYIGCGLEKEDIESEAQFGLKRAAELWQESMNVKFPTYAAWWMHQCVTRALHDSSQNVRVPPHIWWEIKALNKLKQKFFEEFDRLPSIDELAEISLKTTERLLWLEVVASSELSLDYEYPTKDGDTSCLYEVISDKRSPTQEQAGDLALLRREIDSILDELSPQERSVICKHNGYKEKKMTFREIGKPYKKTHERMRQIEAKIFKKLRFGKRSKKLRQIYLEML